MAYQALPDNKHIHVTTPFQLDQRAVVKDTGLRLSAWAVEISAATLSISALGALIGVLDYANRLVVHSWHGITLNAVVSALATVSKLAATFVIGSAIAQSKWCLFRDGPASLQDFEAIDLASRGVSGCTLLVWRTRKFALFGAYALLLAVIFDPFAQQLVHYRADVVYTQSNATTIPRATRYSAGDRNTIAATDLGGGPGVNANAAYLLQSAVTSALVQPMDEIVQQLQLHCQSGNCTWPAFTSLGVCSSCTDVHSYLKTSESKEPLYMFLSPDNAGSSYSPSGIPQPTLPNGLHIDSSVQMTTFGTGNPGKTVSMSNVNTLIWSMTMLREKTTTSKRASPEYEAIECGLRYCVEEHKTEVTSNSIKDTANIVKGATRASNSWSVTDKETLRFYTSNTGMNDTITTAELNSLDFESPAVGLTRSDLMLGDQYNVSQTAVDGISSLMYSTFTYDGSQLGINGFYIAAGYGDAQYDPPSVQQLWMSNSLQQSFEILAVSMSNAIRAGSDNGSVETGQEGSSVIKFQIEWPWIALPMLVILASLAQLVVVILSSRMVPLWKESTLAVLSRGRYLDGRLDQATTVREMRAAVRGTKANLFDDKAELKRLTSSVY